jgi:hypothetical protein
MEQNYYEPKIALPNSGAVLALGIISIIGCCCYGIPGLVCGIIALVLAKSSSNLYISEPAKYTEGSYKNLNAGKICAWIGLIFSILSIISSIVLIVIYGTAIFSDPCTFYEIAGMQCQL